MSTSFGDALQRAGPLAGMLELLGDFGASVAKVEDGTGVELRTLTPDSLLPFRTVLRLFDRAALETGCPHFGLLLGARYDVASHGVISRLAMQAHTLRQALLLFVSRQPGYSSGATVYLSQNRPDILFGYGVYERTSVGSAQLYDCVLAFGCNFIRALTNGEVRPLEVRFCHREPVDLSPYRQVMKAPLRFNETQSGLLISGSEIDHPLKQTPQSLGKQTRQHVEVNHNIETAPAVARLRHIIRPQLLSGDPSMAGAAKVLGHSPRMLRRYLAAEGQTFELVRDEVRYVLARELLKLTDLPIGEISAALVFANQSSFVRAFRRWSGSTPSQWRASS